VARASAGGTEKKTQKKKKKKKKKKKNTSGCLTGKKQKKIQQTYGPFAVRMNKPQARRHIRRVYQYICVDAGERRIWP
jgi:ABC-type microcin C transport system permease subunit YejB